MISSIRIKNFKSIIDLKLNFSFAQGKASNGYNNSSIISFLKPTSKVKDRVVPVMNFYGPNASGKSNIIESIYYFKKIIFNRLHKSFFMPNKLSELKKETFLEINFFIKNNKCKYVIVYNDVGIKKEELFVRGNKLLYSIKDGEPSFNALKGKVVPEAFLKKLFRTGCLNENNQVNTFLRLAVDRLPNLNKDLKSVYDFFESKFSVLRANKIGELAFLNAFKKYKNSKFLDKIYNFIKNFDIDIEKISVEKRFSKEKGIPASILKMFDSKIVSYHKSDKGKNVAFDFFEEESMGTRALLSILIYVLDKLENGGVLIVDEFDKSLHPFLLHSLVKLFKDKNYNKKNAQLITTLHQTDILEKGIYKISEFSFLNKNRKRGTFVERLSDFENVRNDMNFRDRYLEGLYKGIPYMT